MMGHFVVDCKQYQESPNNYMDEQDPEMDQIPKPTIQPRANLAQLKACMDTLNDEEHDTLMRMMGETHLQDFLDA